MLLDIMYPIKDTYTKPLMYLLMYPFMKCCRDDTFYEVKCQRDYPNFRGGDFLEATEIALEGIKKLIMNHEYKPGDRIMETGLAEKLKLSRTPIRDALSRLVSSGFIEKTKGQRGYQIPSLTPLDMKLVFETRSLLEGNAACMAAKNHSPKDLGELKEVNEKEIEAFFRNEKEKYANFNQSFHFRIAFLSQNPYIYRFVEQLFWRASLYIFFFAEFYTFDHILRNCRLEHQRLSHQEHKKIIQAIENNDEERAEKLMREHILTTYNHLLNPSVYMSEASIEPNN